MVLGMPVNGHAKPGSTDAVNGQDRSDMNVRSHYRMPDDGPPQDCHIWRDTLDDFTDAEKDPERIRKLKGRLFDIAFGDKDARANGEPIPFYPLSKEIVKTLPPEFRAEYENDLAAAEDERAGNRVRHPDTDSDGRQTPPSRLTL